MNSRRHARTNSAGRWRTRGIAAATAFLLVASGVSLVLAPGAGAADEGISLGKQIDPPTDPTDIAIANIVGTVSQNFSYTLTATCTTFNPAGCANVVVTDTIDPSLEVLQPYPATWTVTPGPTGTVVSIPLGAIGTGSNGSAQIPVRFKTDTSLTAGQSVPVANTGHVTGTIGGVTFSSDSPTVNATGIVRSVGGASASKTANPTSVAEFSGAAVSYTVTGGNTGTAPATSLVVTDLDPAAFDAFDVTSIPAPTLPAGATGSSVEISTDGSTWTTVGAPYTVPAGQHIEGIRVTFTGSIAPAATGSATYSATLRNHLFSNPSAEVAAGTSQDYTNHVTANTVYADASLNQSANGQATVTVNGEVTNPPALSKTISPSGALQGSNGPVDTTISAVGSGQGGLSNLTITDSPTPANDPFGTTLLLTGSFPVSSWPSGATAAVLTVTCAGGATAAATTTGVAATLTAPSPPCGWSSVTKFTAAFTGPISSTATATIVANSTVNPAATAGTYLNDANVNATGASGNTSNISTITGIPFTISSPTSSIAVSKSFTRPTIKYGSITQSDVIQLGATYTGNVSADSVTLQDPTDTTQNPSFYNEFDVQGIRALDCRSGDVLTISYFDGANWIAIPGNGCAQPLPIDMTPYNAQGVRFSYANAAGIPSGTHYAPEVVVRARATYRNGGGQILDTTTAVPPAISHTSPQNCASASASISGSQVASDATAAPCPTVTSVRDTAVLPNGIGITKSMNTADGTHSGREGSGVTMSGSLNLTQVPVAPSKLLTVTDPNSGNGLAQAFASVTNIVSVGPIAVPQYEEGKIQYLVAGTWTDATGWVAGPASVSAGENDAAQAWRLQIQENPQDPGNDPGIEDASWAALQATPLSFTYALRSTFRDAVANQDGSTTPAGTPVTYNRCYGMSNAVSPATCSLNLAGWLTQPNADGNLQDNGYLINDAQAQVDFISNSTPSVFGSTGGSSNGWQSQQFQITKGTANAKIDKTFSDTSVPLPATGATSGPLQQRTVTLIATNDSSAQNPGIQVTDLQVAETDGGFWSKFTLVSASTPTVPPGAAVTFDVTFSDGSPGQTGLTLAALNALPNIAAVNGVVEHNVGTIGFIAPGNATELDLLVQVKSTTPTGAVSDTATVTAISAVAPNGTGADTASILVKNDGQTNLGALSPFAIVDTLDPNLSYNIATANPVVTLPTGATSTLSGTPTPAITGTGTAGDPSIVTWTWATGYLAPGDSVTIQVSFDVAAALPQPTTVPNTAGVAMPAQTSCAPEDAYVDGQCQATAILTIIQGAAVRATTTVTGSGVTQAVPGGSAPCPASGPTANPCAAITPADSAYTWNLTLQNSGNTNLSRTVLIDRLPGVGDTGAFLNIPRGSEWRGTPNTPVAVSTGPANVPSTVQYLTDSSALAGCLAELTANAAACGSWITLAPGANLPAAALAIRVEADYGVGGNAQLLPAQALTVSWGETAPANLVGAADTLKCQRGEHPRRPVHPVEQLWVQHGHRRRAAVPQREQQGRHRVRHRGAGHQEGRAGGHGPEPGRLRFVHDHLQLPAADRRRPADHRLGHRGRRPGPDAHGHADRLGLHAARADAGQRARLGGVVAGVRQRPDQHLGHADAAVHRRRRDDDEQLRRPDPDRHEGGRRRRARGDHVPVHGGLHIRRPGADPAERRRGLLAERRRQPRRRRPADRLQLRRHGDERRRRRLHRHRHQQGRRLGRRPGGDRRDPGRRRAGRLHQQLRHQRGHGVEGRRQHHGSRLHDRAVHDRRGLPGPGQRNDQPVLVGLHRRHHPHPERAQQRHHLRGDGDRLGARRLEFHSRRWSGVGGRFVRVRHGHQPDDPGRGDQHLRVGVVGADQDDDRRPVR